MPLRSHALRLAPVLGAAALALAACGGGSSTSARAHSGGTSAVDVRTTSAGTVLTTAAGNTLYVSDQERNKVLCNSSACTAIWHPLTVAGDVAPPMSQQLRHDVTTVMRSDGQTQLAFDGRPLYTFSFDHSAGQTKGNGAHDSFGGTDFTWHTATVSGTAAPSPAPASTPSQSSGYDYRY